MIKCQACGTQNLDSSHYCDECGDALVKYKAPVKQDSSADYQQNDPVFKSASITSVGVPKVAGNTSEENLSNAMSNSVETPVNESVPQKGAKLFIDRGNDTGKEFHLSKGEANIGRWDADNGVFPDVDLDAYDPEAKVSRKHAKITFKDSQYYIEDLGSTNGTFLNRGRRLIPGVPQKLSEGDEIIVGKTFLRFGRN